MKRSFLVCFTATLLFAACKKNDTKTDSYTPTCTGVKSFSNDVLPLIKAKCWSCHNDMPDYEHIKSISTQMKDNVISGAMPRNDKLSNDQKDIIVCWIEGGAPNN